MSSVSRGKARLLPSPLICPVGITTAVRCKEDSAMLPKPGLDLFEVGLWHLDLSQCGAGKEFKSAFTVRGRKRGQLWHDFKKKHEPMALPLIAVLADQAGKVQICRRDPEAKFFLRLATRARIRRFAFFTVQFTAARTPQPQIRFLRPFHQKNLIAVIETV